MPGDPLMTRCVTRIFTHFTVGKAWWKNLTLKWLNELPQCWEATAWKWVQPNLSCSVVNMVEFSGKLQIYGEEQQETATQGIYDQLIVTRGQLIYFQVTLKLFSGLHCIFAKATLSLAISKWIINFDNIALWKAHQYISAKLALFSRANLSHIVAYRKGATCSSHQIAWQKYAV